MISGVPGQYSTAELLRRSSDLDSNRTTYHNTFILDIGAIFFYNASLATTFPFALSRFLLLTESHYYDVLFTKKALFLWTIVYDVLVGSIMYLIHIFSSSFFLNSYRVEFFASNIPLFCILLISIYLILNTSRTIRKLSNQGSFITNEHENSLRRRVLIVLFFQSLSNLVLFIVLFYNYLSYTYGWYCTSFVGWFLRVSVPSVMELLALLDSLISLFALTPYREELSRLFKSLKNKLSGNSSTSTITIL
jgi:hypothetical protein